MKNICIPADSTSGPRSFVNILHIHKWRIQNTQDFNIFAETENLQSYIKHAVLYSTLVQYLGRIEELVYIVLYDNVYCSYKLKDNHLYIRTEIFTFLSCHPCWWRHLILFALLGSKLESGRCGPPRSAASRSTLV